MSEFALEDQRAELARHRENRARAATVQTTFETTGQGTLQFGQRVDFGLTFIDRPHLSYACEVSADEMAGLLNLEEDATPPLPLCTGYVTEWDIDDREFYIGAWCAVVVFDPTLAYTFDLKPVITHHFSFQAIAMKDVPLEGAGS